MDTKRVAKKVYISGPMTGLPGYNYDSFHKAEKMLNGRGFKVYNPARKGVVQSWTRSDYMREDIRQLSRCDAIHLLPKWYRSKGSRWEYIVARFVFGMEKFPK